jgi:DNA repair exonuclease SbcCD ATPase subunit
MQASPSSPYTDIDALESELRRQLEDLDNMVNGSGGEGGVVSRRDAQSIFDLASAEGEKEALHDRLATLLARSEDFESQQASLRELASRNEELLRENAVLRKFREDYIEQQQSAADVAATRSKSSEDLEERYKELEFTLAETRSKLARAQQAQDDHLLARELAEKRLDQEKVGRSHAEKERDAYAAAYEASLKHFERWSNRKIGDT